MSVALADKELIEKLSIKNTALEADNIRLNRENMRLMRSNGRMSMWLDEVIELRREIEELRGVESPNPA